MTDWAKNISEQEGKIFLFSHYGLVPSLILRDPELSAMAKAIYAYLLTYVNPEQMKNGSFNAWPSRKRILRELNISVNTLSKYLNELRDANLIVVEQIRKTLKDGKQVYGNNLYKLQTHVSHSQYEGVVSTPDLPDTEKANSSKPDHLKSCDSPKVNTSNTKGLSSTKINSNTNFSTTSESKASSCSEKVMMNFQCAPHAGEGEREILVDEVITAWNQTGVNIHHRLGTNTKRRIQTALDQALEDYSMAELLGTITIYAKLYKSGKSKHRYRLVEFLEKRGYEHFQIEENWNRSSDWQPLRREDFTYTEIVQDHSQFAFLNDSCGMGTS